MRWYDLEPNTCIAISMIEMSDPITQIECAKFILNAIARETNDCLVKNVVALYDNDKYPKNRWSDKNEFLRKSFDCLKEAPKGIQSSIALDVLEYLRGVYCVK